MRALFFGTPEIAVPSLLALAGLAEVVGVVCQPDRPSGRGLKLQAPAVKVAALERGFDVLQPTRVRTPEFAESLRERRADVGIVIAYGRILPREVLEAPRLGCLNLHASLLPRYRGAAPIQRALMAGERVTGVCLMQMDEGLDTGPVLATRELDISEEDDAGSLFERVGECAGRLLTAELPRFLRGELVAVPQDDRAATWAPPLGREDQRLDFSAASAGELVARIRGLSPRPGAQVELQGEPPRQLRIARARVAEVAMPLAPGEIRVEGARILVGTARGPLEILEAQLQGKRLLSARDLVNGRAFTTGDRLR